MPTQTTLIGRRDLLSLAIPVLIAATSWRPALAATTDGATADGATAAGATAAGATAAAAAAPIQRLDAALLTAMKAGKGTPFSQRYAALAPVVEQTFDLDAVLAASIGLSWAAMPSDQKARLLASFRRYTVASYAANFDNFTGQTFRIAPSVRNVTNDEVVVSTEIVATDGTTHKLDYVMRNTGSGWKAVDVLADGSISRVAVQRSDFRQLLSDGGAPALVTGLQRKVASLSGGMLA